MLSQSVGYAAVALGVLAAARGRAMLVKEIAEIGDIPSPYLAKLINMLGRKGIVETQRGIGGGVVLIKKPEALSLYELCEMFDDPVTKKRCMLGTTECSDERACPCHKFWTLHRDREIEFLKKTTIADLGAFERKELLRTGRGKKVS